MSDITSPIIVVGPGRCGTSTVARLLTELGVCMGDGFRADDQNPKGYFEDADMKSANTFRIEGVWDRHTWSRGVLLRTTVLSARSSVWGWKDPRTAEFIGDIVEMFPGARYVRCVRNESDTLVSYLRCYTWSPADALAVIRRRNRLLDEHLPRDGRTIHVCVEDMATQSERVTRAILAALLDL